MIETLGTALQSLKQAIAQNVDTPIILPQDMLERQFHGLSLSQLIMLTDASVLAASAQLRLPDGTGVERFTVDGKDAQQRAAFVRRLLLDADIAIGAGNVREVRELQGGALRRTFVRDHSDVVYEVGKDQAAIDQELTAELQGRRRPRSAEVEPVVPPASKLPVIVNDPLGFYGTAGAVLHGLAALHTENQVAFQVLHGLTKAGGEGNAESALVAAGPQVLFEAMGRILSAARQIETLVDTLNLHMTTLLRLVERAESYIDPAIDPNSASR